MAIRSQADIVKEALTQERRVFIEDLRLPDIENLHTKPRDEIAVVLTNVLKSRSNITKMVWTIGKSLELTYEKAS